MLWRDRKRSDLPTPLPNTYWVQPGRLLAGEYPGSMTRAEALQRVQILLQAGVTSFIDLTEPGELPAYEDLLPELTEERIRYRRLPVLDHSVPASPAHMGQIVDAIDAELAAQRCVYVHCHAGIGRTGTAVACWLIRGGLANEAALEHLQTLWRQCARSRRWPSVPETPEQVEFVRQWRDASGPAGVAASSIGSRYEGALSGLALGDAFGALVEKNAFDAASLSGGRDDLLITGAHTAMTRAVLDSLLVEGAHDASDQMRRYLEFTRAEVAASIPAELKRALAAWQWSKKPNAGSHDPKNLDAHSLPRSLAVALRLRAAPLEAIDLAAEVSRTTQQSPIVLDLCRVWTAQFIDALDGVSREELVGYRGGAMQRVRQRRLKPQVKALLDGAAPHEAHASDALGATHAALNAFAAAHSLREALLNAAAAPITPAAAALCGALSGAYYGVEAIPAEWRQRLGEHAELATLAQRALSAGG